MEQKNQIKFLKKGIRYNEEYIPVFYSSGDYNHPDLPQGTITIYAKDYSKHLPVELKPENNTEIQTDYFETDRARITPDNKYYEQVNKQYLRNKED